MILNYKDLLPGRLSSIPNQKRKRGNQGTKKRRTYKDIICAFDIETSRLDDRHSVMYIWQFQLGDDTYIGRSWKECLRFFRRLAASCADNEYYVIYVHNLSFEFQFLSGQYDFTDDEVFCVESRKILKCDMFQHLEFRCSYLHTNMSLAEYLEKMGVEDQKLSGYDYDKIRYPWTPLTDQELEYCIHDVKGLVQALKIEMEHDNDNLYSIPLTSTGYVRRDVKHAMRYVPRYYVKDQLPDWETYTLLREAFRGGNTHANRYYAGMILKGVKSADRSSSYPDTECNDRFPVTAFRRINEPTADKLSDLVYRRKKAVLCRVALWDVKLKDPYWGCPYLSTDKCRNIVDGAYDNGRILSARYLETTLTDIDLKIVLSEYSAYLDVITLEYARYGTLPPALIECIQHYYTMKTELKNVTGQEIFYIKAKNKLNSVYGMSAQNPVKQNILYRNGDYEFEDIPLPEILDASNKKAFFPYQWGVWCSAWGRYRLEEGIRMAHSEGADFVYCDTDSVKYLGDIDWDIYNKERKSRSEETGSFADDPAGNRHYMGVYEFEGEYKEFATRGAKKYVYTDQDDKLHITIAGVNKSKGAAELEAMGGIRAFLNDSITFTEGETEAVYIDHIRKYIYVDGHRLRLAPCVTIRPSQKTVSDTDEYAELLKDAQAFRDFTFDKYGEIIIG